MREIIAILKKAFFSSIIMTVLLSIVMYLRGYPAEISFVIKYISPQDSARLLTRACIYLKINKLKLWMKIVKSSLNEIDILGKRQDACAIVWECINKDLVKRWEWC